MYERRPLPRRRSVSRLRMHKRTLPHVRPACGSTSRQPRVVMTKAHLELTLRDMFQVFCENPDLEQKYLNMMKMPITGKECIRLPFDFNSHRQHTCLDLSPYGNEQVSKSACTTCRHDLRSPTASDALVAFINQPSNIMKNRRFYYGFRKDMSLIRMSANQPQLFQIYHIVHANLPDVVPLMHASEGTLHMHLVFEGQEVHIPCDCIGQVTSVARDNYSVILNILKGYIVLSVVCTRPSTSAVQIDVSILQRKVDEMEIPNEVNEQFELYKAVFDEERCF
uniref:Nuclear egress lamina protein n=1 Tax=Cardioderma bat herpesvirus TaxID=3141914 RepID=A0AAU7E169_9VIRU